MSRLTMVNLAVSCCFATLSVITTRFQGAHGSITPNNLQALQNTTHPSDGAQGNTTSTSLQAPKGTTNPPDVEFCCFGKRACAANNTACTACQCLCLPGFTYDTSKESCQPLPAAPETTTTTTRKAQQGEGSLPNQPCSSTKSCVEGLVCVKSKCACPKPCVYLEEKLVCDCGSESIAGPIVVGVFMGSVMVVFWGVCISGSIKKHKAERDKVTQLENARTRISTLGSVYGTDHLAPPPAHRLPTPPRLSRQTVAPTSPLVPAFRYTALTPTPTRPLHTAHLLCPCTIHL